MSDRRDSSRPDFEHQRDMATGRSALSVDRGKGATPPSVRRRARAKRRQLTTDEIVEGVRQGNRAILGRAITLTESRSDRHREQAEQVLTALMPETGKATRIGITGVPGAGKSTFIDAFGTILTGRGHKVAVLAVDPSSNVTGGSVLGDKTRMTNLSVDPNAFIRPSPSAGTLGGVAARTRETMLICEAAGFDTVLVETVGVGQGETVVAEMTDSFMALMIAGAGDELQGIKRGLLELVDLIAINKADGDNADRARRAAMEYQNALRYMHPRAAGWQVPVMTCSALTHDGLEAIWRAIQDHRAKLTESGELQRIRRDQLLRWMWALVDDRLRAALHHHDAVREILDSVKTEVTEGRLPPTLGARQILEAFGVRPRE